MSDKPEMVEANWMDIAVAVDDHMTKLRTENEKLRAERDALKAENEKLRAALLLARVAVSHACELSDRILYTQDLVRIDAALGEKK